MRGVRLFKSTVALLVALVLTLGGYVRPAQAMSTSTEVAQGRAESAEIDAQSVVIHDPFLVSWVNSIGERLAENRKRRDIQFQFIILGDPDINAFALKGGYIHVNMGLLNFVSSDDELAATMGHEMGHVELRHVVKGDNTSTILGILTAIASMLSPVALALGSLGGELASDKYSRIDELQADHYGLQLMSDAGYDPQATVDVMDKLGALDPGPDSKADKAFIDHPVPQDRVAHLEGYPQLDSPNGQSLTEQAIHDQEEGRYSYANAKFREAAKFSSQSPLINEHEKQLNYALRESGALAAPDPRVEYSLASPDDAHRVEATKALIAAQSAARTTLDSAKVDARTGSIELGDLEHHIDQLAAMMGGGEGSGPVTTNSGGVSQANRTAHLIRDISGTVDLIGDVLSTAPGLIGPNEDALRDMAYPLSEPGPLTPKSQALLGYYPFLTTSLQHSTQQLQDSIALSREVIAKANQAVQISTTTLAPDPNATPVQGRDGQMHEPPHNFSAAIGAWDATLAEAQHASDEMYAAQTAGLSAQITLLDVLSSPDRYNDFREALIARFPGQTPPTYSQASSSGITPGEIACASWLSFETKSSVTAVMSEMRVTGRSCEQIALDRGLLAESMEIAEGLVYEDYVDMPSRPPTTSTAKTAQ